ncbi:MAG: hypothetical protein ACI8RZ_005943 [Myxococcota bacterium]
MVDSEPILVEVIGVFELGLLVAGDPGQDGQLRLLDMRPEQVKIHVARREAEQVGRSLSVFVMHHWSDGYRVSEWSPAERKATADAEMAREQANADAEIGAVVSVVVRGERRWGLLCDVVGTLAEGVILTDVTDHPDVAAAGCPVPPPHALNVGAVIEAKVIGKNPNHGALIFGLLQLPEA